MMFLTTFNNPPVGLAIPTQPLTPLSASYRVAGSLAPTIYVAGEPHALTPETLGQIYDLKVADQQVKNGGKPLTPDEQAIIGNALLAVLDKHVLTVEDRTRMVFIDGRYFTSSRENLNRLELLMFTWKAKQAGRELTAQEKSTYVQALAAIANGKILADTPQAPSTVTIAVDALTRSAQEAHDLAFGKPKDGHGGILGALDVVGYAFLVWAIAKAIGPRGISGLVKKGK